MNAGSIAADPLHAGWGALRAFFHEGMPAVRRALEAFHHAEGGVRRSGDSQRLGLWLLGLSTALRYTRTPEPMETGLERARELVNLTARTQGEEAAISYRTHVEAIYRDLAEVVPAPAPRYLQAGREYSDRTLRLAQKVGRDEWLAVASESRADLLMAGEPADGRTIRRALTLYEDARRRWPGRDPLGRSQASLGYAKALLAARQPAKAELVARESLEVFLAHSDRYHEAAARLALARALYALGQTEALDEQAAAVALYRALGCRWEFGRAEGALA